MEKTAAFSSNQWKVIRDAFAKLPEGMKRITLRSHPELAEKVVSEIPSEKTLLGRLIGEHAPEVVKSPVGEELATVEDVSRILRGME